MRLLRRQEKIVTYYPVLLIINRFYVEVHMTKLTHLYQGQKFHKLTVISLHHIIVKRKKNGDKLTQEYYLCKCDCGKETIVEKSHLTKNVDYTESCGCSNGTHHKSNTKLFKIWIGIKKRCFNKKCKDYKNYGGRGITICDEWKNDFMSFYNWAMDNGYQDNLTIDRINNDGNYEPNNCKWSTRLEQNNNKRNIILIFEKETNKIYTISQLCNKLNISYECLYARIQRKNKNFLAKFSIINTKADQKKIDNAK